MKVIFLLLILICGSLQLRAGRYTEYVDAQLIRNNIDKEAYRNQYLGSTLPCGRISVYLMPHNKEAGEFEETIGKDSSFYGFCHSKITNSEFNSPLDVCLLPTSGEAARRTFHYKTLDWKPGYSKIMLEDSIVAETTATLRTGIHNYTYPHGKDRMLWISFFSDRSDSLSNKKEIIKSQIRKKDETSVEGYQIIKNHHSIDKIYFSIKFSASIKSFSLEDDKGRLIEVYEKNFININNPRALLSFDRESESLLIKVGLSDVSIDNARENLEKEASYNDFGDFVAQADSIWESSLGKIEVRGIEKNKIQFYTALYTTFFQTQIVTDVNGEWLNPDMSISKVPPMESQFSLSNLGDSFRLINPLSTLISPEITKNYVNSVIRLFDFEGSPYAWDKISYDNNLKESPAIPIVVDAVLKRIPGIDSKKVWDMVKTWSLTYGVDNLSELFEKYGYIPEEYFPESVTYTLQKSFEEWCAVRLAGIYGDMATRTKLSNLATNYRNIYNEELHSFSPKDIEGKWIIKISNKDNADKSGLLIDLETMSPYYWYVHYDIKDIIKLSGGKAAFEKQLDNLFNSYKGNLNKTFQNQGEGYKELKKSFLHAPYLYNYIGKPNKTRETLTKLMEGFPFLQNKIKNDSEDGLLAAWFIFSSMGFYPVNPCGGYFDLGCPFFDECVIHLPNGKDFVIASNRNEEDYYKSVKITLNDKPVRKNYITFEDIMQGGKLVFGS